MKFRSLLVRLLFCLLLITAVPARGAGPVPDGRLASAVADGKTDLALRLLAEGVDPDDRDGWGNSAMLYAAGRGDFRVLDALFAAGADPCAPSRSDNCVIHEAVESGRTEVVGYLLDHGLDIETLTHDGKTPLQLAADRGRRDMCAYLLDHGADILARKSDGLTPLHLAACRRRGVGPVVGLLLARGVPVDARSRSGRTPLHLAASWGSVEGASFLLAAGADPNAADDRGATPLHGVSDRNLSRETRVALVELLLAHGADPDAPDRNGRTPLGHAEAKGRPETVLALLRGGADVRAGLSRERIRKKGYVGVLRALDAARDPAALKEMVEAETLHEAVRTGDLQTIRELAAAGVSVDIVGDYGQPPLLKAVCAGRFDVVEVLLDLGASVAARGRGGRTAIGTVPGCVPWMTKPEDQQRMVDTLLKAGADINAADDKGQPPLELSLSPYMHDLGAFLLARGADPNAVGSHGRRILEIALCESLDREWMVLLLDAGADPDARDRLGRTVLLNAAAGGRLELCRLLAGRGADLWAVDKQGRNAVHLAAGAGRLETCRFLVEQGVDYAARDADGRTPLGMAAWKGARDVAAYLRSLPVR